MQFPVVLFKSGLPISLWQKMQAAVAGMENKALIVEIKEAKKQSSDPQRRYYFSVIVPAWMELFREYGTILNKDECHLWLKENVGKLRREVVGMGGEITSCLRSYRDLVTHEAEDYHTECRRVAASWGKQIPEPHEDQLVGERIGG